MLGMAVEVEMAGIVDHDKVSARVIRAARDEAIAGADDEDRLFRPDLCFQAGENFGSLESAAHGASIRFELGIMAVNSAVARSITARSLMWASTRSTGIAGLSLAASAAQKAASASGSKNGPPAMSQAEKPRSGSTTATGPSARLSFPTMNSAMATFGWFGIFTKIYLPLSKPALIAAGLILFVFQWQAYLWPLLIAPDSDYHVASVAIASFAGQYDVDCGQMFGGAVFTALLPMAVLLVFQRYFIASFATTGSKD
jgi:hypothetical protein